MATLSGLAVLEHYVPSKVPVLSAGDLNPAVMRAYENTCLGYFEHKDIMPEKQVRKILSGLHDTWIQDWISVNCTRVIQLTFPAFMTEFRVVYLPEDWEEVTWIELLAMTQADTTFWDFAVQVQAKNSLLRDTPSFLDKEKLRHRLELAMRPQLALRCRLEKSSKIE
jgi:hypothetical protein